MSQTLIFLGNSKLSSIILVDISQTDIYINTLKNHTSIIQQKSKTYTVLGPTLKQVIVRLHSIASPTYLLCYVKGHKRLNETYRTSQKFNCSF